MSSERAGPLAATALVVASMIGTGVFTSLGFQLDALTSAPQILLLWLLGGLIALCGALCYALIARELPRSGGEHHFLTQLYHPSLGFMAGLISAISGFAAPTALTALAFGNYLHEALPGIPVRWAAAFVILVGGASHMVSNQTSARVQIGATAFKLLLILGFLAAALVFPGKGDIRWAPSPEADLAGIMQPAFAISLLFVLYSYSGWNAAIYGLEEWDRPAQTVRRALIGGTLIVTVLYIALNAAFLRAAPVESLRGVVQIGHVAAASMFGESAARPVAGLFAVGLFASVSAMLWAGPRVLAAMGRSTPALAFFEPSSGVPKLALLFQVGLALLLVAVSRFQSLLTYTQIGLTLSTMLTVGGVFLLKRKSGKPLPTRFFLPATIFLGMTAFIVIRSMKAEPIPTLFGLLTVIIATLLWFPLHRIFK